MTAALLISQGLNESFTDLVTRVNAALQSKNTIAVIACVVSRRVDAPGPRLSITLLLINSASVSTTPLLATCFVGTPLSSAAVQASAFLTANPTYRGHFLRDLGDQRRGKLDNDALMLIYATTGLPNCGWDKSRAIVVINTNGGSIAAGGTGSAQRVTGTGLADGITITNRSIMAWPNGVYGYAFPRPEACSWDAIPTCCGP